MKHLAIFGRPVVETVNEISGEKVTPFVRYYDEDDNRFVSSNTEYYKDHIKELDIPMEIIFRDYIRFFGPTKSAEKLLELFDITPKK